MPRDTPERLKSLRGKTSLDFDFRHGGHSRSQQILLIIAAHIEKYLYRHALNDLNKVPGCVLRRQQAEPGSRPGLNAIDVPFKHLSRVRIDGNFYRLTWMNFVQLGLLEVGGYPNISRHDGHQSLAGLNVGSNLYRLAGYMPGFRSVNLGVRKFQLRLIDGSLGFTDIGAGALSLGLADGDLLRGRIGRG